MILTEFIKLGHKKFSDQKDSMFSFREPTSYYSTTKSRVTNKIFKLALSHASVICQIHLI